MADSDIEESMLIWKDIIARVKAFEKAHPRRENESLVDYQCRLREVNEVVEMQLESECQREE